MMRSVLIAGALLWAAVVSAAPAPPAGRQGPGAAGRPDCPMMQGGGMRGPGMPGRGAMAAVADPVGALLMHRQMLNLTDDQVNRLTTLRLDNQKQLIRRGADLMIAHIDLMQLLSQANPDRRRVEDAIRDMGRQLTEVMLGQARAYLDALQVLTPDQRQMIQRMMAAQGPGMPGCPGCPGGMMGGMMGGHGAGDHDADGGAMPGGAAAPAPMAPPAANQ